jgi:hypothetical protein
MRPCAHDRARHQALIGEEFNALVLKGWAQAKRTKCPICKRGTLVEGGPVDVICSRRYAPRSPCDFDVGICDSRVEFERQVQEQIKIHAKR